MSVDSRVLRKRIIDTVERGEGPLRQIAQRFPVNLPFVTRPLRHDRTTGPLEPKPHGEGRRPALGPAQLRRLRALIRKEQVLHAQEQDSPGGQQRRRDFLEET
jgi:transposase